LSAFAFSRQLFGDHCFDQQYYNTSDRHWSYADYAAGNSEQSQESQIRRGRTLMQVLRRGRSTRVDSLLDWLVSNSPFQGPEGWHVVNRY
jgi:hypothetical protein